ncbi:MAG: methyltransferase domain-containing protein [Ignavibacteriae bacterium]|nr:methyltransferase domain-containing protein [Ignavibacteriota bacterium]
MAWYKNWFADALYLEVYSHRDADEARQAVELFTTATGLLPPSRLLDLACGTGRHAFEFARRGYEVVAADLSQTLLAVAHRKTRRYGSQLHLVRTDMRHVPFSQCFDGVAQLFTAFGYFIEDDENAAVFLEVAACLRPDGWYMLDYLNPAYVRSSLQPESARSIPGGIVREHRAIRDGRIEKDIRIERENDRRLYHESVRLFERSELESMLARAGLRTLHAFGDYQGNPFTRVSPRCILLARMDP